MYGVEVSGQTLIVWYYHVIAGADTQTNLSGHLLECYLSLLQNLVTSHVKAKLLIQYSNNFDYKVRDNNKIIIIYPYLY